MVRFHDAEIDRNLDCSGGTFSNPEGRAIDGTGAQIGSNVYFSLGFNAIGCVRMNRTQTGGEFICSGGEFSNPEPRKVADKTEDPRCENALKLRNAIIKNVLWLGHAAPNARFGNINKKELWRQAKFKGSLDLRDAHTAVLIDHEQIWRDWIDWNGKPEHKDLQCNILLEGFTYDRLGESSPRDFEMRRRWLECQPQRDLNKDFKPQPFRQLAKVLGEMGHGTDARRIAIEEQVHITRKVLRNRRPFLWMWRKLRAYSFRYGYRPDFVVTAAVVLWAVSAGVYYQAERNSSFVPIVAPYFFHDKADQCRHEQWTSTCLTQQTPEYPSFNALVYSADVLLPFVNLRQEEYWQPKSNGELWPGVRSLVYFEKLFGWVAAIMLTSILGGVIKR